MKNKVRKNRAPKVLVIEDDRPLRNVVELKLQSEGVEVFTLTNGEAAIDTIQTGEFGLVLLDIVMPFVNGFKVLEDIQQSGMNIHVTVVSNLCQPEDINRAKSLGARDYFIKSDVSIIHLVDHVKTMIQL